MTGAVKKAIKRNNLNCELSLQDIWFIFSGLTGFGLKRNGAKMMEICYIFDSTIVQHFSFCARLQFLEKQERVFHSFFVSLFFAEACTRTSEYAPLKTPSKTLFARREPVATTTGYT
jgi:hypothetical protein